MAPAAALEAPNVTAAICTHRRPAQLRRALRSLRGQTEPPAEILVVDNAPAGDETRAVVLGEFPGVRYVREAAAGLDFARNRALAEATSDIVAFLDDDAVADPVWVAATRAVFRDNPVVLVCTGRVDALSLDTEGARLFEANGGFARGADRIRLPRDQSRTLHGARAPLVAWAISVGSGCSFAVRRTDALAMGGFDEALDLGEALPGGGDLDMIYRALARGRDVVYEPAIRARHEHRADARAVAHQIAEHNRALVAWLTKLLVRSRGRRRAEVLAFLLWRLAKPGVRLARRAARRDPLGPRALARLWWAGWRGLVAYPAARRLARQRRDRRDGSA
ncbi:MAG: glycosyltransferase [Gemmatimonadaceae bacterium]